MDLIWSALSESLYLLFRVGVAAFVWWIARSMGADYEPVSKGRWPAAYARVIGACAVLALIAWAGYGTHVEDADPLFGGGELVTDFVPTEAERNKFGLVAFFTLATIALHGTHYGRRHGRPSW